MINSPHTFLDRGHLIWMFVFKIATSKVLCDKVYQWLATGSRWFSPGPLISSTNKTDRHDITEILLKVALNTIKQTNNLIRLYESLQEECLRKSSTLYFCLEEYVSFSDLVIYKKYILKTRSYTYGFFFAKKFFFSDSTRVRIFNFFSRAKREFFFRNYTLRLYDKNSESDFFFLHQNQNIFSATLGIRIFF